MCVGGTVAVLISNIYIRLLGEELSLKKESCKNARAIKEECPMMLLPPIVTLV